MKRIIQLSLIAFIAFGLTFTSCKKKNTDETTTPDDLNAQVQTAADEHNQTTETENSLNEANDAMNATGVGKANPIPGATLDSSNILQKKIVITYNGYNYNASRYRTGTITLQLTQGNRWKDAGAELTITYTNFKVTRTLTQKSMTFNGTVVVTNVNGGRVFSDPLVVHTAIATKFNIMFDDSTKRVWNLSRKRTFTNTAGVLDLKTEGTGSQDGYSNLLAWGQNRAGNPFYVSITTPIEFNSKCYGVPVGGVKVFKGITNQITATFGLDAAGVAVDYNVKCPTNYRIDWTNGTNSRTKLLDY